MAKKAEKCADMQYVDQYTDRLKESGLIVVCEINQGAAVGDPERVKALILSEAENESIEQGLRSRKENDFWVMNILGRYGVQTALFDSAELRNYVNGLWEQHYLSHPGVETANNIAAALDAALSNYLRRPELNTDNPAAKANIPGVEHG